MIRRRRESSVILAIARNSVRLAAAAVLTLAGYEKLLDLPSFLVDLESRQFVPRSCVMPIAICVPALKALLLPSQIRRRTRVSATMCGMAMSFCFICFHAMMLATHEPPDCPCTGLLDLFHQDLDRSTAGLWLAVFLLAAHGLAWFTPEVRRRGS